MLLLMFGVTINSVLSIGYGPITLPLRNEGMRPPMRRCYKLLHVICTTWADDAAGS
jgi:hypothetical protein